MREVKRCTGGWSNKASLRGSSCFAQTAIVQGESMANVSTRRRLQHLKNQSEVLRTISNYMSAFSPSRHPRGHLIPQPNPCLRMRPTTDKTSSFPLETSSLFTLERQ